MVKRVLVRTFITGVTFSLCLACGKNNDRSAKDLPNVNAGETGSERGENGETNRPHPKVCRPARILEVLNNGKNVYSRLLQDRSKIINWNSETGEEEGLLDLPVNPYKISPDGQYILRQITFRKYQVINLKDRKSYLGKIFQLDAAYEPMPEVNFSENGKFVILNYRPYNNRFTNKIDIYSLEQEKFVSSLQGNNIFFASLSRDGNSYLLGLNRGYQSLFQKIDRDSSSVIFEISLNKYERFNKIYVGDKVAIIRGSRNFHAYDLETGEHLYDKTMKHIFDVGTAGELALIADSWEDFKILDMATGETLFQDKIPIGLVLSTCKLLANPISLVCKDPVNQNKVFIWNIEKNKAQTSCF